MQSIIFRNQSVLQATLYKSGRKLWVLTDRMYNKYVLTDDALFSHLHGSSWHGDDAKSILWILHHPIFLAVLTLTGTSFLTFTYVSQFTASAVA